jgi:hypothetical protein
VRTQLEAKQARDWLKDQNATSKPKSRGAWPRTT